MNVAGKTVLITGANRGIGRALVDEALRRGAQRVYAGTRGTADFTDERVVAVTLDVTSGEQIQRAAAQIDALDILINNAGIAINDDLGNPDVIERHLAVNLFGMLNVTRAFLPLLRRSGGAVVNNLSLAALAPVPVVPAYSISKAAAFNMTQSLRAYLAPQGVRVHAVILGPVDTDMSRQLEVAKASPEAAAAGILDGVENDEEEIFPDALSRPLAEGWRAGVAKAVERANAEFLPETPAPAAAAA